MATLVKQWADGGNLTATYEGSGKGTAVFSSDVNEGIDREMSVQFVGGGISVERKVTQVGLREEFTPSDGNFILADGGTFNVLKEDKPYTEIEYIESDGSQWIDTKLLSSTKSKVDVIFSFNTMEQSSANNAAIFGGRNAQTSNTFTLFKLASANPQYLRFDFSGQKQVGNSSQLTWKANHRYRFLYNGVNFASYNLETGESYSGNLSPSTLLTTNTICLFCVNTNGVRGTFMKGKIYRYTYTDGVNYIDLIPVIDKNGVACMYDRLGKQFYYNQGSGNFIAGSKVSAYTPIEYIESTGTQWIDTKVKASSSIKVETKIKMNETPNRFRWLFAGRNQSVAGDGFGFGTDDLGNITSDYNGRVSTNSKLNSGVTYTIVKDRNVCQCNDIVLTNNKTDFSYNYNIALLSMINGEAGSVVEAIPYCRCYYFKVWENDILIRDMIPAIDKDGIVCMYDKLNNEYYYNQGTGQFNYN